MKGAILAVFGIGFVSCSQTASKPYKQQKTSFFHPFRIRHTVSGRFEQAEKEDEKVFVTVQLVLL